jgi:mannose-6-phosphate isomerase-like protein (cupin superfamily)
MASESGTDGNTSKPSRGQPVSITDFFSRLPGPYQPHRLTTIDDKYELKISRFQGPFIWHSHPDADELFIINKGVLRIGMEIVDGVDGGATSNTLKGALEDDANVPERYETLEVKQGEMLRIPKGVRHRPDSVEGCEVIVFEKIGTMNTGDVVGSKLTRDVQTF